MITSGEHVDAKTAHAAGLVDELVPEGELRAGAIAFAKKVSPRSGRCGKCAT